MSIPRSPRGVCSMTLGTSNPCGVVDNGPAPACQVRAVGSKRDGMTVLLRKRPYPFQSGGPPPTAGCRQSDCRRSSSMSGTPYDSPRPGAVSNARRGRQVAALVVAAPATTHGVGALRWHLHQLWLRVAERAQAAAIDTARVQIQRAVDPDRLRHDLVAINDAWRCPAAGRGEIAQGAPVAAARPAAGGDPGHGALPADAGV